MQTAPHVALRNETLRQLFQCSAEGDTAVLRDNTFGTLNGIYSTRFEDLVDYHGRFYRPGNALLFGYGNVAPDVMLENLEESLRNHRSNPELDSMTAKIYGRLTPRDGEAAAPKRHEFFVPETDTFQ